jgi:hypothetical protein
MYMNRMLSRLILGVSFVLVMTAAAAAQSPSGSVSFESAEGSTMGDTQWTGCTLLFKGKLHACTISGLSSPVTGLARVSGMVYGLKKMGNFAGTYKAAGDEFALGSGHLTVKNQHGVKMVLSAFSQLAELQTAEQGIEIKLKEEGKKAK